MKKKPKTTPPTKPTCGVKEGGIGMPCELQPGHEGKHKNRHSTFGDPPPLSPKKPRSTKASPATKNEVKLTDACPKCGRELGEHDGKKCPPMGADGVYALIVGSPGKDTIEIGRKHARLIQELEKAGRIEWRDQEDGCKPGWYPTMPRSESRKPLTLDDEPQDDEADAAAIAAMGGEDDDPRSARWECGASFADDEGRARVCEARNEHHGPHYAWCKVLGKTVHAAAATAPGSDDDGDGDGDDPLEDEVRSDADRDLARQQREAREAHAREIDAGEPSPIATSSPRTYQTLKCGSQTFRIHPAALIFPTPEEQYRQIVESIRTEGQKHPIELIVGPAGSYLVIDGCSRIRACDELGIEPRTKVISTDNPYKYVIAVNLARRHLDESQRAMAAAELANMEHGANQHSRTGNVAGPPTQAEAAQLTGVSERLVRDAAKVKRDAVPEVTDAVRAGRITVTAGADLAKLSPAKQRQILDKEVKGSKSKVKPGKIRTLVRQEEKRAIVARINKEQVRPMPVGPFRLVVADYPWPYENSDQHEGSRGHITYPAMSEEEILRHAREDLMRASHDDCIAALWFTNHFVHLIGPVLAAAGLTLRSMITWDKMHAGVGTWPRGQTEHLVIASRGNPTHTLNEITTYFAAPRTEHSRKPEGLMDLLERHCPGPHLELFAREQRRNWASWGAETDKFSTEAA